MDVTTVVVAAIPAGGAIVAAWFAYRSSTRANAISEKKVDAESYERAKAFYERLLADADRQITRVNDQLDRVNSQFDKVNAQLAQEQDVSNALRNHVRDLQRQVTTLESSLVELKSQLGVKAPH